MFLLVPAHPGCTRQSPESRKMVVVEVIVLAKTGLEEHPKITYFVSSGMLSINSINLIKSTWHKFNKQCVQEIIITEQIIHTELLEPGSVCIAVMSAKQ